MQDKHVDRRLAVSAVADDDDVLYTPILPLTGREALRKGSNSPVVPDV